MSIFDGIMSSISSFGDALSGVDLGDALGAIGAVAGGSSKKAASRGVTRPDYTPGMSTTNKLPYGPGSFEASKGKATEAVDPDTINAQWLSRLNRYSQIATSTGKR